MNQERKNNIFWGVIGVSVLIVAFSVWSGVKSYADSIQPSSFRSFTVTAEGKVTEVPDVAVFSFSVVTEGGKNLGALVTENTTKMNKAIDFVKSNEVEAEDIKTQNYNISPRYQTYNCYRPYESGVVQPCPPAEIVGYTISQSVEVKVRNFDKIGDLLGGVVDSGANSVSQLQFTIDDPVAAEMEARAEAMTKAKIKAKQIAKAGGFSVGRLLSVDENNYYPRPMYSAKEVLGLGVATDAAMAPSVEPGSQEVTVNVILRYEIE